MFYEPNRVHRRDAIDLVAGRDEGDSPRLSVTADCREELGNAGRLNRYYGRPGEAPAYAKNDFIIVRDGRIAATYLFSKLPGAAADAHGTARRLRGSGGGHGACLGSSRIRSQDTCRARSRS